MRRTPRHRYVYIITLQLSILYAPVYLHYYVLALHSVRAGIFTLLRHAQLSILCVPHSLRKKLGELDMCLTENLATIFISFKKIYIFNRNLRKLKKGYQPNIASLYMKNSMH